MSKQKVETKIDETLKSIPEKLSIEDMPLETYSDYIRYNREARVMNKKLKLCRYPIKPCPIELHPMEKIVFGRVDQPENMCQVKFSNDMIDFEQKLYPGKEYMLPRCVVDFISSRGTDKWKWKTLPDGSRETYKVGKIPRFALRTVYAD